METIPLGRRIRRHAVTVLCALVSAIALAFIVPAAFGLHRYVIAGQSMTGTYNLGSVVFDRDVPVSGLEVGDVITYMPPADTGIDHLVTHRIVSIRGDHFRTKGDANPARDPWTFRLTAHTQPKVAFHVPYLGFVFLALQNRDIRMLLIGVPAALVALLNMGELVGAVRRRPQPEAETPGTSVVLVDARRPTVPAQRAPGTLGGEPAEVLVGSGRDARPTPR